MPTTKNAMPRCADRRPTLRLLLLLSFLGTLASTSAHALLIVEATVTPATDRFHFDLVIDNTSGDDFSLITLANAPIDDALLAASITGPAGFGVNYDPALGLIDLLEGATPFLSNSRTSGFSFDSATPPSAGFFSSFHAITTLGDIVTGDVRVVREPVLVPTADTAALLGIAGLLALRRRRTSR